MPITLKNGLFCLLLLTGLSIRGGEFRLESAGARFGFSSQDRSSGFIQAEAFADFALPWKLELGKDWHMLTRLDGSLGYLSGNADSAIIGSVGPFVVIGRERLPVSLSLGASPTLIGRDKFGSVDFGIPIQFTLYAGINWNITERIRVGYRYQHMSNAHLDGSNPGLNLNMFSVSYCF